MKLTANSAIWENKNKTFLLISFSLLFWVFANWFKQTWTKSSNFQNTFLKRKDTIATTLLLGLSCPLPATTDDSLQCHHRPHPSCMPQGLLRTPSGWSKLREWESVKCCGSIITVLMSPGRNILAGMIKRFSVLEALKKARILLVNKCSLVFLF